MRVSRLRCTFFRFLLLSALLFGTRPAHPQVGQPSISGAIAAQGYASGSFFVDLRLTNSGSGSAQNVRVNTIQLRTLSGTGTVTYNTQLSGALPRLVGDLAPGASTIVRLYLNLPSSVSRFSITEGGSLQNSAGTTLNFCICLPGLNPSGRKKGAGQNEQVGLA